MTDLYLLSARNSCSAQDLIGQSYLSPDGDIAQRFLQANAFAKPTDRLMRGELYAIPGLGDGPRMEPGIIGKMVSQTNFATRNQRTEPAADEFNANFGWMKDLLTSDATKAGMETVAGTLEYFEKRAEKIATTFRQYKSTYDLTVKTQGFYQNSAAKSARAMLDRELQAQLTGITRSSFLDRPHTANIKDQLGISHKALKNQVKLGKNLKELEKIEAAAKKAQGISSHLKKGGTVLKIVSVGATVTEIGEEFATGGTKKGLMKTGEEGFGLAGSALGGKLGGAAGGWAAGAAMAAFGVGTGGLGFVAVAIGGVVVGSIAGGAVGEEAGKHVWGKWGDEIYTAGEDAFAYFKKLRTN